MNIEYNSRQLNRLSARNTLANGAKNQLPSITFDQRFRDFSE